MMNSDDPEHRDDRPYRVLADPAGASDPSHPITSTFRVLGPLEVSLSGRPVDVGPPRQRTVLSMLLLGRNQIVPVHRLATAVWDEHPPMTARNQLQICVSGLRRLLAAPVPPARIVTMATGYQLQVADGHLDLDLFDRLVDHGHREATAGNLAAAIERLRSALHLWRGPPLADVASDLVRTVAVGIQEKYLSTVEECLELELLAGNHHQVAQDLAPLVVDHPHRERFRRQQMLALYRNGRKADALAAYQAARRAFIEDLGLEPSEQLRQLEHAMLTDAAEIALPSAPVYVASPTRPVPRQLPPDLADLTGRDELVAHVSARMLQLSHQHRNPLALVITGGAGIGKTALAVRVAHHLAEDYPDGQLYLDLHGSETQPVHPGRALDRLLRALGVAGHAIPDGLDERLELYRDLLSQRRVLLLLDDASGDDQIRPLLPGGPGTAVLATSRRRLVTAPGAQLLELGGLGTDAATELLASTAGADRIRAEPQAAASLAAICGGLPLALRIAGSRLASRPHWTVRDLVRRLADERRLLDELVHGELGIRVNLSVTYEALPELERRLFRLLGLLRPFDFPAWACAPLLDADPALAEEALEQLVDVRLVEASAPDGERAARYHLHDLLRVYARERLAAEEPAAARQAATQRLVGCLLYLVEQAHRREYGGDYTVLRGTGPRWRLAAEPVQHLLTTPLAWLDQERVLLVAAVDQAARAGFDELAWELAAGLVTLFELGAYFDDWRETHESALAAARATGNRTGVAAMRYSLGGLAIAEQQPEVAATHLEQARQLFSNLAHLHGQGLCLRHLAFLDRQAGRLRDATDRYQQALTALQSVGDRVGEAHVLSGLAQIAVERSELAQARQLLDVALGICRATGNRRVASQVLHRTGEVDLLRGDHASARIQFELAIGHVIAARDQVGEAYLRHGLSACALRREDYPEAEVQVDAGLAVARRIRERMAEGRLLLVRAEIRMATGRTTAATASLAEALRHFQSLGAVIWQTRALDLLGQLYRTTGDPGSAAEVWRQAMGLVRELEPGVGAPLLATLHARLDELPTRPGDPHHG